MSAAEELIQKLYGLLVRVASSLQPAFLLCIRVYFGLWPAGIAVNGWGKLHNLGRVTQFFASLGLPAPGATATFVATFEFVAGILLAIGLLSRVAALGLVIDMLTAYITSDREVLSQFLRRSVQVLQCGPVYLSRRCPGDPDLRARHARSRLSNREKVCEPGPGQQLTSASFSNIFQFCSDFVSSKMPSYRILLSDDHAPRSFRNSSCFAQQLSNCDSGILSPAFGSGSMRPGG